MMRLIVFADAGFGSLTGSHSVDGSVAVWAEAVSRDGITDRHGALLDHRCAKIQRVWKSSLASECRAALTASDQALRTKALLHEIVTGAYIIRHISPPSEFPLPDPRGPSPKNEEARRQRRADNSKRRIFSSYCKSRRTQMPSSLLIFADAEWEKATSVF